MAHPFADYTNLGTTDPSIQAQIDTHVNHLDPSGLATYTNHNVLYPAVSAIQNSSLFSNGANLGGNIVQPNLSYGANLYDAAGQCLQSACPTSAGSVCASDTTACDMCLAQAQSSSGACSGNTPRLDNWSGAWCRISSRSIRP